MSPWIYRDKEFTEIPEGVVGFVYLITNLTNGRKYIGKKNAYFCRLKKNKNKRNKRVTFVSDWKDYWSSSEEVKKDVADLGEDQFRREILYLCNNKSQLNYFELREQIDRRVLERNDYYNGQIYARVRKCKQIERT